MDPLDGSLDTDRFARAVLAHRNTPIQGMGGKSPAMIVFGRHIAEFVPHAMNQQKIHSEWRISADQREKSMAPKYIKAHKRWAEHTRDLPKLVEGDKVFIQNQEGVGKAAKKWDKVGVVADDREAHNDTYLVRVLGAGTMTVRNRAYLRKYWNFDELGKIPKHAVRKDNVDKYCPDGLDPDKVSWEREKEALPKEPYTYPTPVEDQPVVEVLPSGTPARRRSVRRDSLQDTPPLFGFATPTQRGVQRRQALARHIEEAENPGGRPKRVRLAPRRFDAYEMVSDE